MTSHIISCSRGIVSGVETIDGIENIIINTQQPMIFSSFRGAKKMVTHLQNTSKNTEIFKIKKIKEGK